jgi:cytochrome bd-type quinol oxidase subunit 2
MKPALRVLLVLALLSGLAFAQQHSLDFVATLGLGLFVAAIIIGIMILSIIISAIVIFRRRKEKDGSLKKRQADFAVKVAIISAVVLVWAIGMIVTITQYWILELVISSATYFLAVLLILILVPLLIAAYIWKKCFPKPVPGNS